VFRLFDVPVNHVDCSFPDRDHGVVAWAGSAFQAARAVRSAEVSNTCGDWPGPGTLCTRVPAGIGTTAGDPGADASVNASVADADTPGDGTYPTRAAISVTDRCSTAVRRNASFATRSL